MAFDERPIPFLLPSSLAFFALSRSFPFPKNNETEREDRPFLFTINKCLFIVCDTYSSQFIDRDSIIQTLFMLIINKWMSVIWCSCCWWIAVGEFVVQICTCFMQILLKIYFIFICVIVKNLLITFCYKILIICWLWIYYKTVIANNNLLGKSLLIAKLYFISFHSIDSSQSRSLTLYIFAIKNSQ